MNRPVVITGCSTGIGRACAEDLLKRNFDVIATVRREADAEKLRSEIGANLKTILLDVTSEESMLDASKQLAMLVEETGLHGLVNNAGGSIVGPVEFVSLEKWRQQFELNFFGQVRMTQLLLPLLRRRVKLRGKGSARIIFMSSIAGRLSQPILSPYCASKHAVEALADSLRLELCGQGIQVSLIEPGAIKSEIWDKGKSQVEEMPDDPQVQALYGELIKNVEAAAMKAKNDAIPAIYVSRAVEKCLAARRAPARVVVGRDAKLGAFARSYFPTRWVDGILSRMMGVPR